MRKTTLDWKAQQDPVSLSRRRWVLGGCGGLLATLSGGLMANGYPSKAVRVIVGQGPGGPSDRMARLVAQEFSQRWKETAFVENHAGATGMIAGRLVAQAAADGYTILVSSNSVFAAAALDEQIAGYDPLRAFAPVGRVARGAYVLAVRPGFVATVQEFVARARAQADSVSLATAGAGGNSARALILLQRVAGIRLIDVPYNGGGYDIEAVIAGHVDATFIDLGVALPFVASGVIRLLAACSPSRLALAPELPTFAESGFPGVVTAAWYGLAAPAATSAAIISKLAATLHSMIADSNVRRRLAAMGCDPISETPEEFATAIRVEVEEARALAPVAVRR